ncbi:MAG: DUF559 domain-containing protein [Chitinophagaceae bacterium]|nr:DUF559 domain-containing protein [Chitinophagaceae bacterium]
MSSKNPYKTGGMFDGAFPLIFENAKALRKNMTAAENALWLHLKSFNGYRFRRQHPLGIYIVDFYCHKLRLIIEVDGSIHDLPAVKENDERRQHNLTASNYNIVRFPNEQVLKHIGIVLTDILAHIEKIEKSQKQNTSSNEGV